MSKFLDKICVIYDEDLIKKCIQNPLLVEHAKKIYSRIQERDDYEMLDFLAKERPDLLRGYIDFERLNQSVNKK